MTAHAADKKAPQNDEVQPVAPARGRKDCLGSLESTRRKKLADLTDTEFRCPAVVIESWHAQRSPVYAYQFEEAFPGRASMGAQHSDEVFFVFGTLPALRGTGPASEQIKTLSETTVAYWSNFAKTGDPNGAGIPHWPRFTFEGREFIHLNSTDVHRDANLRREPCELFAETVGAAWYRAAIRGRRR